jgi:hypothetical protein
MRKLILLVDTCHTCLSPSPANRVCAGPSQVQCKSASLKPYMAPNRPNM